MFVLSVLEAPNTKTNSLCVQTYLAIKVFLILIWLRYNYLKIWNLRVQKKKKKGGENHLQSCPNYFFINAYY